MDDGDSHPASESNNQVHQQFSKHNLRPFQAAGYAFFLESFIPETSGQALQAEREERISNT